MGQEPGRERAQLSQGSQGHWRSPTDSAQEEEEEEEEGRENILFRLQGRELLEAEQSQVFKSAPSPQGGQ